MEHNREWPTRNGLARHNGTAVLQQASDLDSLLVLVQGLLLQLTRVLHRSTEEAVRPSTQPTLTPREWEVLEFLAIGLADKEIAANLSISIRTVRTHLEHVRAKLALRSRRALGAWYWRQERPTAR